MAAIKYKVELTEAERSRLNGNCSRLRGRNGFAEENPCLATPPKRPDSL